MVKVHALGIFSALDGMEISPASAKKLFPKLDEDMRRDLESRYFTKTPGDTDSGMSQLFRPCGTPDIFVTTVYARQWCADHPGWKFEELQ